LPAPTWTTTRTSRLMHDLQNEVGNGITEEGHVTGDLQ
jgi:hypothetical protein